MLQAAIWAAVTMQAPLELPAIFGDHMVLQHGHARLFGQASPGTKVTVSFRSGQTWTETATAGADGRWQAELNGPALGAEGTVTVQAGSAAKTFSDVLIGDVWLCSGQSNMEWPLAATDDAQAAIAAATDPKIRLFTVTKRADATWQGDVTGKWVVCSPEEAAQFSAVGYHFGLALRQSEGIPIGLIDSTWGGTPAEAWTPRAAMAAKPALAHFGKDPAAELERIQREQPELLELMKNPAAGQFQDQGNKGAAEGWMTGSAADWKTAPMPQQMQRVRGLEVNGVVWFRRDITLTAQQASQAAKLSLGPIDDYDITYVNGKEVGATPPGTANAWSTPRLYTLPAGTLKAGVNTIAVRVLDTGGAGGLMAQPQEFRLDLGAEKLPLAGEWSWKIEQSRPALPPNMPAPFSPNGPSTLWQGMVKPLVPYGLKGAIWYQGESNVGRDREYAVLLPTMVQAWRKEFGVDFAFLFVQLANYQARKAQPGDSAWAALRESQMEVLSLPKTGFATAIDIGEANDIHPRNKRDVGRRLAASARTFAYPGTDGWKAQSPRVATVRWESSSAVIDWLDASSLKTTDGRAPVGFAVQSGGGWVWTEAEIRGRQIVVRHPEGKPITAVQYAWAENPEVNLVNEHDLPAVPFRRLRD